MAGIFYFKRNTNLACLNLYDEENGKPERSGGIYLICLVKHPPPSQNHVSNSASHYNTNLIFNLANNISNTGTIRETFFLNQLRVKYDVIVSTHADFLIGDYTFEVGGKNKGLKQIQGIAKAFIVKDDIEQGYLNTISLWQFGLTY